MPLTRSLINAQIDKARKAFKKYKIVLPPWAWWTIDQWKDVGVAGNEIRDCLLGWEVTDFGSNRFPQIGRVLFTVRSGSTGKPGYPTQKYLCVMELQRGPALFHPAGYKDICCLGGGNLMVQLCAMQGDHTSSEAPFTLQIDGISCTIAPRQTIRLKPGQSVCVPPRTIHQYWAEERKGIAVSMEISSGGDDGNNEFFFESAERFPRIFEDVPPKHHLCHEYPPAK